VAHLQTARASLGSGTIEAKSAAFLGESPDARELCDASRWVDLICRSPDHAIIPALPSFSGLNLSTALRARDSRVWPRGWDCLQMRCMRVSWRHVRDHFIAGRFELGIAPGNRPFVAIFATTAHKW